jgi:hypothetical protein
MDRALVAQLSRGSHRRHPVPGLIDALRRPGETP